MVTPYIGVEAQVAHHVLGGVAVALKTNRAADVSVGVHQARDHRLAGERDALGAGGHGHGRRRAGGDDLAVAHDQRGVVDRRAVGAVDEARAGEGFDGRG